MAALPVRVYDRYLVVEDIYPDMARVRAEGCRRFADLGGGRGELCGLLAGSGVATVLVDLDEQMLGEGTRPGSEPTSARCRWPTPRLTPRRPSTVSTSSPIHSSASGRPTACWRRGARSFRVVAQSVERSGAARRRPRWGRASPFDSEDSPALVAAVFGDVEWSHGSSSPTACRITPRSATTCTPSTYPTGTPAARSAAAGDHQDRRPRLGAEVAIDASSTSARRGVRRRPYVPICAPSGRDSASVRCAVLCSRRRALDRQL